MSYVPGFDVQSMSDDELYQKQAALSAKLSFASYHASSDMVMQIQRLLNAVHAELSERVRVQAFREQLDATPDIVESDPEMRPPAPAPKKKATRAPPRIGRPVAPSRSVGGIRASRTSTPNYDETPSGSDKDTE